MQIKKIAQGCQGGKQTSWIFFNIHLDHESVKKPYTYELFRVFFVINMPNTALYSFEA